MLAFEDFLNEPPQYEDQRMVRDYRHEAYRKWSELRDQINVTVLPQPWRHISTAPKDRRVGLLIGDVEYIGRWEADRYAQKPRPYWQHETFGRLQISDQRKEQPTMWRELRATLIAEERTK